MILAILDTTLRVRRWATLHPLVRQLTAGLDRASVVGPNRKVWRIILMLVSLCVLTVSFRCCPLTKYYGYIRLVYILTRTKGAKYVLGWVRLILLFVEAYSIGVIRGAEMLYAHVVPALAGASVTSAAEANGLAPRVRKAACWAG